MKIDFYDDSHKLLVFMLSAQGLFIVIYLIFAFADSGEHMTWFVNINKDNNLSESFQYVQEIWIITLLILLIIKTKNYFLIYWPITFVMFLAEDAFGLHERKSFKVAGFFNLDNITRNTELLDIAGQIIVLVVGAMVFFGLLVVIYRFGNKEFRRVSKSLFIFLAIIAFFAIVVDAVHQYVTNEILMPILAVIEEGGEMVTTSFIVWYLFGLVGKSWDKDGDGQGAPRASST